MEQVDRPQEIIPPNAGIERDNEVRELSKKVERLHEIEYAPGFENYAAVAPMFEQELKDKVRLRFSWGKDAPNMSAKHFDPSNNETPEGNLQNYDDFLESQGFTLPPDTAHIIGNFQGTQYQKEEVATDPSDPHFEEQLELSANFVFTRNPNITLTIKPADCPIVIGYCKDKFGNDLVFIDHSGADAANASMSRQGLLYLRDELGVDLSKIKAVMLPGVSKENYFITNEPERRGNGISEESWKDAIDQKYPDYIVEGLLQSSPGFAEMSPAQKEAKREEIRNGQKRHVDIPEATIWQLVDAGIPPENIQAIIVDSYESARNGEAYSHRFTTENGGKRKGRGIVAVQLLSNKVTEQEIPDRANLPKAA